MPKLNWWDYVQIDKIGHILCYGATAWCFKIYYHKNAKPFKISFIYIALIIMGVTLECLQQIMQLGRHFDLFDILANCFGVASVAIIKKL